MCVCFSVCLCVCVRACVQTHVAGVGASLVLRPRTQHVIGDDGIQVIVILGVAKGSFNDRDIG